MEVAILEGPFDPWQLLARRERELADRLAGHAGAATVFVGTMREFNEGDGVTAMYLEHYPGMTERHLEKIRDEALRRWEIDEALVVHRVGEMRPGDPIVLVAVWSAHRAAAFDACRYLIEELKHRAPFWKRETLEDGSTRWVEQNTPG